MISITNQSEGQEPAHRHKKKGYLIGFGCIILAVAFCLLSLIMLVKTNMLVNEPITITDVVLTTGITSQLQPLDSVTRFPFTQPRIYCLISISSPKPVNVGVRWYYEGNLIYDDKAIVENSRAFYIEPLPGNDFKPGKYKVEVYLVNEALRTMEFTVSN
jgi:hypothetical protein